MESPWEYTHSDRLTLWWTRYSSNYRLKSRLEVLMVLDGSADRKYTSCGWISIPTGQWGTTLQTTNFLLQTYWKKRMQHSNVGCPSAKRHRLSQPAEPMLPNLQKFLSWLYPEHNFHVCLWRCRRVWIVVISVCSTCSKQKSTLKIGTLKNALNSTWILINKKLQLWRNKSMVWQMPHPASSKRSIY